MRLHRSFRVIVRPGSDHPMIRQVDVPTEELNGNWGDTLDRIFYWGQNDFQSKNSPSVSVGDFIIYEKVGIFRVDSFGFTRLDSSL